MAAATTTAAGAGAAAGTAGAMRTATRTATWTAVAGASAATAEAAVARAAAGVGVLHVLPPHLFFFLFSFLLFIFISSIYIIVVFTLFYFIKLFDTAWNMAKLKKNLSLMSTCGKYSQHQKKHPDPRTLRVCAHVYGRWTQYHSHTSENYETDVTSSWNRDGIWDQKIVDPALRLHHMNEWLPST
jgi:hypothetical protein